MSRIGRLPINIPDSVEINLDGSRLSCKGPKGELNRELHKDMIIAVENGKINVSRPSESKNHKSLHGLTRSLIANMVEGVSNGFTRKLEIIGIGYKAEMKGKHILLSLGFSHPILMSFPESIKAQCPTPNEILIEGIDKELLGMIASKIRSFKKPEPYKGKGIRYSGEFVRKKAGKTCS